MSRGIFYKGVYGGNIREVNLFGESLGVLGEIFSRDFSWGKCTRECPGEMSRVCFQIPTQTAGLQVSMSSGYDLSHRG